MKPTNQKQQVIHYLINWKFVTMKGVILDSLFHKFNTRLSEIENEYGTLTKKNRVKFINKFGNKSDYYEYKRSVSKKKLKEIFNKLGK